MPIPEKLTALILRNHVSIYNYQDQGRFVICFDRDANEIPFAVASANWKKGMHGQLQTVTPEVGNGCYAILRQSSMHMDRFAGGSKTYEFEATDWSFAAVVTEPAAGGTDVLISNLSVPMSAGMVRFTNGI